MNYFRKIIYLCEYKEGECRGNIGFVKLSKKQTRFKIEISLSGDWSLKGEKVYLLDKDKNAVNKVFFGTITEEGNEISITKQTSVAGMLKGNLAGVLIGGEGYVVCAGTEDESVRVEDYVKAEREDGNGAGTVEMRGVDAVGEREKDEVMGVAESGKKTVQVGKEEPEVVEQERQREREKMDEPEVGVSKGVMTEEIEREREKASEAKEGGGREAARVNRETGKKPEGDQMPLTGGEKHEKEKKSADEKEIKGEEIPEEEEMIEVEVEEEHDQAYIFRKLFTAKPNMYPFEDDEMEKCVQIAPGDFSDFPKEYWHMGSNTFLLQGYYNYRHLILARDSQKVYVGIPGQYHRRDKYMADMFGFGRFKSILQKKERLGDFGYWMMEIEVLPPSEGAVCVKG